MNNYYNVGTKENPVISNSSLSCLNPEEGGSIRKFLNFFGEKEEQKNSMSLDRGKLIHKYIEKPSEFIVSDVVTPTEMMAGLIERLVLTASDMKNGLKYSDVSAQLTSNLKNEKAQSADLLQCRADLEKIGNQLGLSTDDAMRAFRQARNGAYKSKNESTIISDLANLETERNYIKFLLLSRDKISLTIAERDRIVGAITSLQMHPKVSALLGLENNDFDGVVGESFTEVPVYWQESLVEPISGQKVTINCKALLDRVTVNHNTKTIQLKDLKSTRRSIYQYQLSFEEYHTYRQMGIYNRSLRFWFTSHYPDLNFNEYAIQTLLIPVETQGLYCTTVFDVSQPWIFKGRDEAKSLMTRYSWHQITGEYRYSPEEVLGGHILKFRNPL